MAKETVEALIQGGKATAAPPLGPALGPLGVNIGQIVAEINKKTEGFKGMQVPVTVTVDTETKSFTISVGTPPASALIMKEAGVNKGSSTPNSAQVADLKMEQIIKIAKMKQDVLLGADMIHKVKEILGTCRSMGILVEGKLAQLTLEEVNKGVYDEKIISGKTELSAEELKELAEEKKHLQHELEKRREEFLAKAKQIAGDMQGKETKEIRKKLEEAGIPEPIINEVAPKEEVTAKPGEKK